MNGHPRRRSHSAVVIGVLVAHAALALAMRAEPTIGQLHAYAAIGLAVFVAAISRSPSNAVLAASYVASAEVLWRMTRTPIFWESAKYALVLVFSVQAIRRREGTTVILLPLLYLLLLAPSALVTLDTMGLTSTAREAIAFNMAGPVALGLGMVALRRRPDAAPDPSRVLIAMLGPLFGVLTLAVASTLMHSDIEFHDASNPITSGGYGPNQVSAVLALGALCALALALASEEKTGTPWWLSFSLGLAFMSQSLLTFSRGGALNTGLALTAGGAFYLRDRRTRLTFLVACALGLVLMTTFVVPRLNQFTKGAFEERFSDTSTTGRVDFMEEDLEIFLANPLLGVGPGGSSTARATTRGHRVASHTEFTRALAEHGTLGLLAMATLGLMLLDAIRTSRELRSRAWAVTLTVWCMAEFMHSAWRLAAVSLLLTLVVIGPARPVDEDLPSDVDYEDGPNPS